MDQEESDRDTIIVLMKRFNQSRLPRAKRMLKRVKEGEKLTDYDVYWLKKIYRDGRQNRALVDRHPEYRELVSKFADLYSEITSLALENEKAG